MIEFEAEVRFAVPRRGEGQGGVERVSATLRSEARILALFGRSGSGKSTVVNMLAGLVRPTRGHIVIDGETWFDAALGVDTPIERRGVGYVFQDGLLFPHLNVGENLRYGARRAVRRDVSATLGFDAVVDLLGLRPLLARVPASLSGGERQRVAIGRALLSQPRLLLMDEPLASLDNARRGEILRLIEAVRDEFRVRIVYVSHSVGEVTRLADEVAVMNDGCTIACADTETVFNRDDLRPYTGRFEGGVLLEATATRCDERLAMTHYRFDGGELVAPGTDTVLGARVRIRIRARDVAIALTRPSGLSIRNVLPATVAAIDDRGGAIVEVRLSLAGGGHALLARITRAALDELQLAPGLPVFALIKAIAFDRRSLGFTA